MSDHHHYHHIDSSGDCCCQHPPCVQSVTQTIDEMDWQRGIWSAALDNDLVRMRRLLRCTGDQRRSQSSGNGAASAVDSGGYTALHYAAGAGHLDAVKLLLDCGAVVDARTPRGATALHRACLRGHAAVVSVLIKSGACLTARDTDGATALHRAASATHSAICRQLVETEPKLKTIVDTQNRRPADVCSCAHLRQMLL